MLGKSLRLPKNLSPVREEALKFFDKLIYELILFLVTYFMGIYYYPCI